MRKINLFIVAILITTILTSNYSYVFAEAENDPNRTCTVNSVEALLDALTEASSGIIDTIILAEGTYELPDTLYIEDMPITIKGEEGKTVTICPAADFLGSNLIGIYGSNVQLENLTIKDSPNDGIYVDYNSNVIIKDVTITDCRYKALTLANSTVTLYNFVTSGNNPGLNSTSDDCSISFSEGANLKICGFKHAEEQGVRVETPNYIPTPENSVQYCTLVNEHDEQECIWEMLLESSLSGPRGTFFSMYEVTFILQDGSTMSTQKVWFNLAPTEPPKPSKSGYKFEGWFWNPDNPSELQSVESGSIEKYDFKNNKITSDTYLYAKFTKLPSTKHSYIVRFESNGGTLVADQIVTDGGTASKPTNPTKSGYTFEGWYADENLTILYNFGTLVTNDITLYAKWRPSDSGSDKTTSDESSTTPSASTPPEKDEEIVEIPKESTPESVPLIEIESKGYVVGYPDGSFRANNGTTRAEVAQMLYFLTRDESKSDFDVTGTVFVDVKAKDWFALPIEYLVEKGVLTGYPGGEFRPNEQITRAEFITLCITAKGEKPSGVSSFADVSATHWAVGYIATAQQRGYIVGDEAGFRPDSPISRAEAVRIINNMFNITDMKDAYYTDLTKDFWAYDEIMIASIVH